MHDLVLADGFFLRLDADDGARERAWLSIACCLRYYFDLFATGLIEDLAVAGIAGQVDGEALERLVDGIATLVGDGADVAIAEVLQDATLPEWPDGEK